MKNKIIIIGIVLALALVQLSTATFAQVSPDGDLQVAGLEVEKLLNFGSGMLAAVLFALTILAYKKSKKDKLLYVSFAFLLFAIKGFLTSTELFFGEYEWVDPVASFLNFGILLSFFLGVLKK